MHIGAPIPCNVQIDICCYYLLVKGNFLPLCIAFACETLVLSLWLVYIQLSFISCVLIEFLGDISGLANIQLTNKVLWNNTLANRQMMEPRTSAASPDNPFYVKYSVCYFLFLFFGSQTLSFSEKLRSGLSSL